MNWKSGKILKRIKRFFAKRFYIRNKKIYNMRRRRESVASVYRKTTKFLTSNTANFLKKKPNNKKNQILMEAVEDCDDNGGDNVNNIDEVKTDDDDIGERDLDYYLGVRKRESYWRDPAGKEQIRKDYLVYHCGITEEDYDKNYKKTIVSKVSYVIQPRLKQVPFKIHRRRRRNGDTRDDSWREKTGIFKLFMRRDSENSMSDSYSECDSNEDKIPERLRSTNEDDMEDMMGYINELDACGSGDKDEGVRIKEVSEGRPCDNCPELCPGFIPHAWSLVVRPARAPRIMKNVHSCSRGHTEQTCRALKPNKLTMCLSLKQLEWADVYRRITGSDKEPVKERKIQKFPSRERNYAVKRKFNNNMRSHVNCESCARAAEKENR
ncbi:hypothetical protein HF086_011225 [Spodoptera exigua]|uniref:Uncharacterized protein n=1 Tax=Spodoptera exigua TaxID=7107 RepID=A0A922SKV6_SPOEX|nr:hypothetical protein HF086_011225 [Spodoptera exigua]